MKPLVEEINLYLKDANVTEGTKRRYHKSLLEFTKYLAELLDQEDFEVRLDQVYYIPYDDTEEVLYYLPIKPENIENYLELNIQKGYSWLSINRSALSSLFKFLDSTYNFKNIMYDIDFKLSDYKQETKDIRVPNRQEILKLIWSIIKYSENVKRDSLLFITLFLTGCRINEVLNLTVSDIHIENNALFLKKTKNKKQKYVVTRIGLTEAFKVYCNNKGFGKSDYIFTDENKKKLTNHQVDLLLRYFINKVNIPSFGIHSTRRSFATIMYENGVDINIIRQLLNHDKINSTQVYITDNYIRNNGLSIPIYDIFFANLKNTVGR